MCAFNGMAAAANVSFHSFDTKCMCENNVGREAEPPQPMVMVWSHIGFSGKFVTLDSEKSGRRESRQKLLSFGIFPEFPQLAQELMHDATSFFSLDFFVLMTLLSALCVFVCRAYDWSMQARWRPGHWVVLFCSWLVHVTTFNTTRSKK